MANSSMDGSADSLDEQALYHSEQVANLPTEGVATDDEQTYSSVTRFLLRSPGGGMQYKELNKRIAQRTKELRNEIRALRRLRNVVALPNTLPPELLAQIFIALYEDFVHGARDPKAWFPVLQVCRHWRTVGVNCATLWSRPLFGGVNPAFTKLYLKRSKNAALTINFHSPKPGYEKILNKSLSKTERLRVVNLTISSSSGLHLPTTLSKVGDDAPILQVLTVSSTETGFRRPCFPRDFKMGGAPCLKVLEIENIPIRRGTLPAAPVLTELRLKGFGPSPTIIKCDTLTESLSQMPSLVILELSYVLESHSLNPPSKKQASLWKLQELQIYDYVDALAEFFDLVWISKLATIILVAMDDEPAGDTIDRCLGALKRGWDEDTTPWKKTVDILDIDFPDEEGPLEHGLMFDLSFLDPPPNRPYKYQAMGPLLSFSLKTRFFPSNRNLVVLLDTYFDLSPLTTLSFGTSSRIMPQTSFETAFMRLPNLSEIRFLGGEESAEDFFSIVRGSDSVDVGSLGGGSADTIARDIYLPALRTLVFNDTVFGSMPFSLVDGLIDIIKSRPKTCRIETLCLHGVSNSDFDKIHDEAIREAGPELTIQRDSS